MVTAEAKYKISDGNNDDDQEENAINTTTNTSVSI